MNQKIRDARVLFLGLGISGLLLGFASGFHWLLVMGICGFCASILIHIQQLPSDEGKEKTSKGETN